MCAQAEKGGARQTARSPCTTLGADPAVERRVVASLRGDAASLSVGWKSESLLAGPGPSPSSGTCQGGGTGRAAGHALLLHNECQPLAVRQQAATHVKACWRAAKAGPDRPVAAGESHAYSPAAKRGRGPSHPLKTGSAPPHCPRARVGSSPLWTRTLEPRRQGEGHHGEFRAGRAARRPGKEFRTTRLTVASSPGSQHQACLVKIYTIQWTSIKTRLSRRIIRMQKHSLPKG